MENEDLLDVNIVPMRYGKITGNNSRHHNPINNAVSSKRSRNTLSNNVTIPRQLISLNSSLHLLSDQP